MFIHMYVDMYIHYGNSEIRNTSIHNAPLYISMLCTESMYSPNLFLTLCGQGLPLPLKETNLARKYSVVLNEF
jgi:hypothetical protein